MEIRLTTLEVVPSIDTLVGLSEPRVPEDTTGSVTLFAPNVPLPLVGVTLARGFAGAVGGRSTLSVTFLVGGFANALPLQRRVTVRTVEATWIVLGASRRRVIGVVAGLSIFYLQTGSADDEMLCQQSRRQEPDRAEDRWCEELWQTLTLLLMKFETVELPITDEAVLRTELELTKLGIPERHRHVSTERGKKTRSALLSDKKKKG